MIENWVEEEYASLDLGDKRLNLRAKKILSESAGLGETNPDRSRQAGSLKGLYRMVDNVKVNPQALFSPHNRASIERCSEQSLVYLVQDTTEVDLTKPQTTVKDAGPLSAGLRRGFFFHPCYALSELGVPLGQVDQYVWSRDLASLEVPTKERRAQGRLACFEEKESSRWMEILQSNESLARSLPNTHFISVADSEADICELFCQCSDFPDNFDLIIRGCRKHKIASATDIADGQQLKEVAMVAEALKVAQLRFKKEVSVGPRPAPKSSDDKKRKRKQARTARETVLSIRTLTVTLKSPKGPVGSFLPDPTINVVELLEEQPPAGEEPIQWMLYTSLPVATEAEVLAVVNGYCLRWKIELYFMTLKSGLKIEKMKYQTLERYLNAFAILAVVAWRIEYLKTAARTDPDTPCSKYFPSQQWMAIVAFQSKKPVDGNQPPTMAEFMKAIAMLGGFINKKSQGPPGSKTIWRGMKRFDIIVQAFDAFNQMTCGV